MDDLYLIHSSDYIRHIEDKLTLYSMLRQLEDSVAKLPVRAATADIRSRMAAYSPKIRKMWDGWNIPVRYLVSGDEKDLSDLMEDELTEPEDAGFFNDGTVSGGRPAPSLADHELLLALTDAADRLYDDYANLVELARTQLRRCQ